MANRSIRDERQASAVNAGRPKVGEADPATRRAALKARLNEREPAGLYGAKPVKTVAPARIPSPAANPTADLSVTGAIDKIKARKYRTMKVADEAG